MLISHGSLQKNQDATSTNHKHSPAKNDVPKQQYNIPQLIPPPKQITLCANYTHHLPSSIPT
jgi:hypothetical protein